MLPLFWQTTSSLTHVTYPVTLSARTFLSNYPFLGAMEENASIKAFRKYISENSKLSRTNVIKDLVKNK